jgi:hypothetical protein
MRLVKRAISKRGDSMPANRGTNYFSSMSPDSNTTAQHTYTKAARDRVLSQENNEAASSKREGLEM